VRHVWLPPLESGRLRKRPSPCELLEVSRAFVREDVDPPERSGRVRSASGLPPGAANYITRRGAQRLHGELERLRTADGDAARIAELQQTLGSVTVVDAPELDSEDVTFGSTVTVETPDHKQQTYTVVGVDELGFEPDGVSWISSIGKALLSARLGDKVRAGDDEAVPKRIVKIEYRRG